MIISNLEDLLIYQIRVLKLLTPICQYRFHDTRRWRFDLAWPDIKFATEVNGGEWSKGRHTRGKGMAADCEKLGEAMLMGWNVYTCTGTMVRQGHAVNFIERYFANLEGLNGK